MCERLNSIRGTNKKKRKSNSKYLMFKWKINYFISSIGRLRSLGTCVFVALSSPWATAMSCLSLLFITQYTFDGCFVCGSCCSFVCLSLSLSLSLVECVCVCVCVCVQKWTEMRRMASEDTNTIVDINVRKWRCAYFDPHLFYFFRCFCRYSFRFVVDGFLSFDGDCGRTDMRTDKKWLAGSPVGKQCPCFYLHHPKFHPTENDCRNSSREW